MLHKTRYTQKPVYPSKSRNVHLPAETASTQANHHEPTLAVNPAKQSPTLVDALSANLRFVMSGAARRSLDRSLRGGLKISADFFGICVAGASDPAIDDYLISQLRDLNIKSVRLDYSLPLPEPHEPRLLERLLHEGFNVCLHPCLPKSLRRRQAVDGGTSRGRDPGAAKSTTDAGLNALERLLDRVGNSISMIELGATVNRRRWYEGTPASFLTEYAAAYQMAVSRGIAVAAPNVTDFEPVYNIVLLDIMRRQQQLPRYHSDNLFVERAGEPEQYDHKIAGRRLAGWLKFDLLRKARILHAVSRWSGVSETISTHAAWSLRRLARFSGNIEQKQADYVSRYCIMAALSGVLRQIYWGPLIGQREGLIDDGTDFYPPEIPHVTRYTRVPGNLAGFRQRPALAAFRTAAGRLQGSTFIKAYSGDPNLFVLAFQLAQGCLHIGWTRDGRRAFTTDIYPADQAARAQVWDRDGHRLAAPPRTLSESPTYWIWPDLAEAEILATARSVPGVRFEGSSDTLDYHRLSANDWFGMAALPPLSGSLPPDAADPDLWKPPAETAAFMRHARNQVWRQTSPWIPEQQVVVKKTGASRGARRILQYFKPSRARRSWNGAIELRRRGLPTPTPVAFLQRRHRETLSESYYVCAALDTPHSVRSVFNAYGNGTRDGVTEHVSQPVFFECLTKFLSEMHRKGVFFRDLSAGNILVTIEQSSTTAPEIGFSLIDTARARFFPFPLDRRRRLCDLMRICHPLQNQRRHRLLSAYLEAAGITYRQWMKIPFWYYNAKHRIKNWIRNPSRHPS